MQIQYNTLFMGAIMHIVYILTSYMGKTLIGYNI